MSGKQEYYIGEFYKVGVEVFGPDYFILSVLEKDGSSIPLMSVKGDLEGGRVIGSSCLPSDVEKAHDLALCYSAVIATAKSIRKFNLDTGVWKRPRS